MASWYKDLSMLLANVGHTAVLRALSSGMPFITYAYLFRTLEASSMGALVFVLSLGAIFRVLINFGLDVTAVRRVSQLVDEPVAEARYVSGAILLQFGLLACLVVLSEFVFAVFSIPNHNEIRLIFLLLAGEILWLKWFYQARLRMDISFKLTLFAELSSLLLTFIFIKQQNQQEVYILIRALVMILAGLLSLFLFSRLIQTNRLGSSLGEIIATLKATAPVFSSRLAAVIHDEAAVLIIGAWFTTAQLASFDLARKIINLFCIPNSIINTVSFSYISRTQDNLFARQLFWVRNALALTLIGLLLLLSTDLVLLLGGKEANVSEVSGYLTILAALILVRAVIYYTGTSMLVAFGFERYFNRSVYLTFLVFSLGISIVYLADSVTIANIIVVILVSETFEALYRFNACRQKGIL